MRLCIPTDTDGGLEAPVSAHFGSAPYFTLVDGESGAVEVVVNRMAHRAPGTCEAARSLPDHAVGAVLCFGVGRRALAALRHLGIGVYVTEAGRAGAAADAFRAGRLRALDPAEACGGGRGMGSGHHGGRAHRCPTE
jgi:predicted Fe-Mo cluster-binding NifX family protein